MVHYNTKYGQSFKEVFEGPNNGAQDALAVLGVFIEVGEYNPAFESIINGKL